MRSPRHVWEILAFEQVPSTSEWLSGEELEVETRLRLPERRLAWRAGRYALKRLLASGLGPPDDARPTELSLEALRDWQIRAGEDGCPEAWRSGERLDRRISTSHRAGWAVACLAGDGREVGIDLERLEPRSRRFVEDFFTAEEAARHERLVPGDRDLFAAVVWSIKESALKCARTGLRRDTRSVEVHVDIPPHPIAPEWMRCRAFDLERRLELEAWWRMWSVGRVVTVVSPLGEGSTALGPPVPRGSRT